MAAPTETRVYRPQLYITVTGTDVDAGNHDYEISNRSINVEKGFSIQAGTLTAMTVTILASLDGSTYVDMTNDLTGAATISSDSLSVIDINFPVKSIKVRAARTNATNAVDLKILGGRC